MSSTTELQEQLDRATKTMKWALKSEARPRLEAMLALAKSEPGVAVLPDDLDRDPWLFNCNNGTLELKTGRLREHRREDLITQLCPVAFHADAQCPTWERFLSSVFPTTGDAAEVPGNEVMIQFVQRLLGRCLSGDVSEHIVAIFWGGGANGKTTLLEAIKFVLGDAYSMTAPAELLMTGGSKRHPTEVALLFRKRFIVCSESEEGGRLNESRLKAISGGDKLTARRMKEDFWSFDPTHKVVLCTNHKPRVKGTDDGIWRRLRLVPFAVQFWNPDEPAKAGDDRPDYLRQDKQLPVKLKAEAEGILAWLVRGCLDWQKNGLGMPPEVVEATAEYRNEEDIFGQFIEERCTVGQEFVAKFADIFGDYKAWAEAGGEKRPLGRNQVGKELKDRKFTDYDNAGRWYRGLKLRNNETFKT